MAGWDLQDGGWYRKDGVGSVTPDAEGRWWFWPQRGEKTGPFTSAQQAMAEADK